MSEFVANGRSYALDEQGFLEDFERWDENFAEGLARDLGIAGGLTEAHWRVIRFIREWFLRTGECPLVYQACKANKLTTRAFGDLFPTGYNRGACKLAGLSYRDRIINYYGEAAEGRSTEKTLLARAKQSVYRVDAFGFLVDPEEWDEIFALCKARELKMPHDLSEAHWKVLRSIRDAYGTTGKVPTVFECCKVNDLELPDLEKLFPDGYQRGAVKLAGLRLM